ncbi:MAG: hypothetical protein JWO31_2905 [Phycisphaerales bacterium]|nr:hypothetical protein [Phycisphaerales bacterium]
MMEAERGTLDKAVAGKALDVSAWARMTLLSAASDETAGPAVKPHRRAGGALGRRPTISLVRVGDVPAGLPVAVLADVIRVRILAPADPRVGRDIQRELRRHGRLRRRAIRV